MTSSKATPPSTTPPADAPSDDSARSKGIGEERKHPRLHRARVRFRAIRMKVRARPHLNFAWRFAIGTIGTIVLIVGVIAIPYPGPGWLIVFTGLGILATEFEWAGRLLRWARGYYDRWVAWVKQRSLAVQLLLGLVTCAVVVVTLWVLGAFWIMANVVGLTHWTWLQGPFI